MIQNILSWLILVLVTILFGWLTVRAWKTRKWFIKWPGVIAGGLLMLATGLVSVIALIGLIKIYAPSTNPTTTLQVAGTPEQIARGEHIANALCVECHTTDNTLPLIGGRNFSEEIPLPIGTIISANLTPGGPLSGWSDTEIFRALREGVDHNGHKLAIMSAVPVRYLSDEDTQAVIAYLRSQPAVKNNVPEPPDQINLLAVIMVGANMFPLLPPVPGPIVAPTRGATVDYGAYILGYSGCRDCHGANLTGGTSDFGPRGPSLHMVKDWTQDEFIITLRTGVDPSGHALNNKLMPWKTLSRLDDVELSALYAYLTSLK